MGGEGSMMSAINSLKNNRSLLSKRKEKKALSGSYSNLKMKDFPEATPQKLRQIKEKLTYDNERSRRNQLIVFIGLVLFIIFLFSFLKF